LIVTIATKIKNIDKAFNLPNGEISLQKCLHGLFLHVSLHGANCFCAMPLQDKGGFAQGEFLFTLQKNLQQPKVRMPLFLPNPTKPQRCHGAALEASKFLSSIWNVFKLSATCHLSVFPPHGVRFHEFS
jgi:hypothetical protein